MDFALAPCPQWDSSFARFQEFDPSGRPKIFRYAYDNQDDLDDALARARKDFSAAKEIMEMTIQANQKTSIL